MEKQFTINLSGVIIDLMVIEPESLPKYLKTLTYNEIKRYDSIKHSNKKLEFAASRFLKHQLYGNAEINYLEHGSPYIRLDSTPTLLSISHSHHLTAISVSKSFPIAVDLELISEKSVKLASKFCSEEESRIFDLHSAEDMTLLWSFKETLYKLSDRNGLIFKRDLTIFKQDNKFMGSVLMVNGHVIVELSFTRIEELFLTCNHSFTPLHATNQ